MTLQGHPRSTFWRILKVPTFITIVFHGNHVPISHRFEAGADVCSTEHRVGPLSPPLVENDDRFWCCLVPDIGYPGGSPVKLQMDHESIYVTVWPQCMNVTDRQTDRPINTDSLACQQCLGNHMHGMYGREGMRQIVGVRSHHSKFTYGEGVPHRRCTLNNFRRIIKCWSAIIIL